MEPPFALTRLNAANATLQAVATGRPLSEVLATLVATIAPAFPEARTSILFVEGGRVRHGAAHGLAEAYVAAVDGVSIGPSAGSCGTAAFTGREVVVADIATDPLWAAYRDLALAHGLRACWSVPVIGDGDQVLATFAVYHDAPRAPEGHELDVCRDMAHLVRVAIERDRAERALVERARLLDLTSDAIIATTEDRVVTAWSAGAERLYGVVRAEAEGGSVHALLVDDGAYAAAVEIARRRGAWAGDLSLRSAGGEPRQVAVRLSYVAPEGSHPATIMEVHTDVSERRRFEEHLLRMQRLDSLGTLAGGVAHDLNNVLTPILMATSLFSAVPGDQQRSLLDTIEGSARRGAELLQQLLVFARGAEGARVPVRLDALCEEVIDVVRETSAPSITLTLEVGEAGAAVVLADATQVKQVILNLLVNARDAMPRGGRVSVRVERVQVDEAFAAMAGGARGGGPHVRCAVGDEGDGIAPADLARVFEPFFTTKPVGQGSGLGLSTAHAIVASHGGFMRVYSERGRGSRFETYWPVSEEGAGAAREGAVEGDPTGAGEGVLVVDDEPAIRQIAARTLEARGYRVFVAAHGAEAVAVFAANRDAVQVVLTDMSMPVMDGPAAIVALRAIDPALPIVGMTGRALPSDASRGASGVRTLAKPFTAQALATAIADALRSR